VIKRKLTKALIDKTPKPEVGEVLRWDTKLPGPGVRIGKKARSFCLQRGVRVAGRYKTRRVSLGRYGEKTVDQARAAAIKQINRFNEGLDVDPEADKAREEAEAALEKVRSLMLREAWGTYSKVKRAPKTEARYEQIMQTCFATWLDRPLREITRAEVRARHLSLAAEVAAGHSGAPGDEERATLYRGLARQHRGAHRQRCVLFVPRYLCRRGECARRLAAQPLQCAARAMVQAARATYRDPEKTPAGAVCAHCGHRQPCTPRLSSLRAIHRPAP